MKILVLNCGSSTIKFSIYTENLEKYFYGNIENIGFAGSCIYFKTSQMHDQSKEICNIADHKSALEFILNELIKKEIKGQIQLCGHRIVHGGEKFYKPVIINEEVKNEIKKCFELAPLHNPHNLEGILSIESIMPDVQNVGIFDTAFHHTIPQYAYIYGIPYHLSKKYNIRRYGFHGISHQYVSEKCAEILNVPFEKLKIITCHLGNGCSITAIKDGISIDTSTGFTPLEGLLMGTRTGDIDPSIVTFLMASEGLTFSDINNLLNNRSGLYGISGISNDMRVLIKETNEGNKRAELAMQVFCYRIKKYLGAYSAVLNGTDAIVFTAGIGENSSLIRKLCCNGLENFGIEIDEEQNNNIKIGFISNKNSKVKVLVIPTDEEFMIAKQTQKIFDNFNK